MSEKSLEKQDQNELKIVTSKWTRKLMAYSWNEEIRVYCVACSKNGKHIIIGDTECLLRVFNPETADQAGAKFHNKSKVSAVAYSPNNKLIASGGFDGKVRIFNVYTRRQVGEALDEHNFGVTQVCFSPDGQQIASSSLDGSINIWNVRNRELVLTLVEYYRIFSLDYSPCGRLLVSGGKECSVRIWNIQRQTSHHYERHWVAFQVKFAPNGYLIASAHADKTAKLWDVKKGKQLNSFIGHTDDVKTVAFSPNGFYLATGSRDNYLRVWNIDSRIEKCHFEHLDHIRQCQFSSDGRFVVWVGNGAFTSIEPLK